MQTAHPVWWTSDNYRNSSFRIYHVDSVLQFQPCLTSLKTLWIYYYIYLGNLADSSPSGTLLLLLALCPAFFMTNFERTGGQTVSTMRTHETQRAYKLFGASIDGLHVENSSADTKPFIRNGFINETWTLADSSKVHIHRSLHFSHGEHLHHMMILIHTVWVGLRSFAERINTQSDLMRYVTIFPEFANNANLNSQPERCFCCQFFFKNIYFASICT